MIKVFSSPFRITQKFGVNPEYYKQFGLNSHEGLDLVPTGSDWSIFSLPYKGIVVKDIDMAGKGGAYGNHMTIWFPELQEAWMYCHLSSNTVYLNQELEPGHYLGQMGSSGNTKGAHLHLNRFKVNASGVRLDKNNGFLGGIDPLPFLEQDLTPISNVSVPDMEALKRESQVKSDRIMELDKQADTLRENLLLAKQRYEDLMREFEAYKAQNPPLAGLSIVELLKLLLKKYSG